MNKISILDSIVRRLYVHPEWFLILSFLSLILLGTMLLHFPWATKDGISWVDALFTATSAVCVTGLVVKNTGVDFTLLGQVIILLLIQLGALGIMTFSASLLVAMGRGLSSRQAAAMRLVLDQEGLQELKDSIGFILKSTLFFELVGMLILSIYWSVRQGEFWHAIYWGMFHSISAFCNAGFSVFPDSFVAHRSDVVVNLVIGFLIIAGGVGFIVLRDLYKYFIHKKRLSVHTKLVLVGYIFLLVVGVFGLYWLNQGMLARYTVQDRLLISWFHSLNARTAGFNSVDVDTFSLAGKFFLVMLMFIGASSGSTGGGIKVSTFFVLLMASFRYVQGYKDVVIFRRTIVPDIIHKAISIVVFSLLTICFGVVLVSLFDPQFGFEKIIFEVVSAFATVGLSCGITSDLSLPSKLVIVTLMFVGRLGPLTIALALFGQTSRPKLEFAKGHIMVG